MDLLFRIILAWNQQGGQFKPGISLVFYIFEGFEYRGQMTATNLEIEAIAKRLQVHIGCVHRLEKFYPWFRVDITGSDRYRFYTAFATGSSHIDRIFEEYDRVVVGKGNTSAGHFFSHFGQLPGRGSICQRIHFAGLGHVPVLAKLAGEIATSGSK